MITPQTSTHLRRIAAIGGGLLGIAALAGCSPTATGTTAEAPASSAAAASSAPSAAASSATPSGSGLKDGSYTATGDYQSPAGPSEVAVTVTLRSGTISAVKVIPKTQDPTAVQYEQQFAGGISGVAVGKKIAGLQVGTVSGSSLTSQGFEDALAKIQKEAAA